MSLKFWQKMSTSHRHLFFDCKFVWCLCYEWLGVTSMIHIDPVSNFSQFKMCNASCLVNEFWEAIWVGVVSEIWKHRNNVIFNKGKADMSKVFTMVQVKVWSWIYSKSSLRSFFNPNWRLNPLACMGLVCRGFGVFTLLVW